MTWKEGGQFENPEPGSHIARCYAVIDLGTQAHSWQGETWQSRDVRLSFELPAELMKGIYKPEVKGKPFGVSKTFKQSMHASSSLRPFLESWRGRKFTKEELGAYDPRKLVGAPCRLTLVASADFTNIDGISKLGAGETCPPAVNKPIYFSLDPAQFNSDVLELLPEKTREKIKASPEYARLINPPAPDEPEPSPEPKNDDVPF